MDGPVDDGEAVESPRLGCHKTLQERDNDFNLPESRNKDSPSAKCQRPSRRADERVEVRVTSCSQYGKLSLKAVESQVD